MLAIDVNADALGSLAGPGITTLVLDGTDGAAVARAMQALPEIHVLVNAIGRVPDGTILDCAEDDWHLSFKVNVDSAFYFTRAALPKMIAQGGGSIITIASVASSLKGIARRAAYSATKAALLGLTKSVAADYIGSGIRCNAVCPGTVQTPSLDDRINAFSDPEEARRAFIGRQPLGRLGTPEEIAGACAYLAADESSFMTGQFFVVDGGITL